jgi:dipeptidyl aminopeptidase/acylaminoacyl peptidase
LALALPASRTLAGAPVDTATVAGPTRTVAFDTDEFTNARVDVSPDGRNMAFDVLGDLYTAPTTGGDARPLTAGSAWDARPRYSPDGKRIAFVSDRGGVATQWIVNADGSGAAEYSSAEQGWVSEVTPAWTAQGGLLESVSPGVLREVFALGKSRAAGAHIDARAARGAFSLDGRYVYVGGTSITRVDLNSGERLDLGLDGKLGTAIRLRVSRDGSRLFYQTALASWNEEVCGLRVRELSTGVDKPATDAFDCAYADFALVPDASAVIAIQRGKFVRIDLSSGLQSDIPVRVHVQRELAPLARYTSRRIVDGGDISTRVIRWPTEPVEGNRVVFGAFVKIYVKDFKGGPPRRLTTDTASEFAPALSPDGKWVVYTTWSDAKMGQVMLVPLAGGGPRPLTTQAGRNRKPTR